MPEPELSADTTEASDALFDPSKNCLRFLLINAQVGAWLQVVVLILGEGIVDRAGISVQRKEAALAELRAYRREAAEILYVSEFIIKDFPHNKFDSVPLLDIVKVIENVNGQFQLHTVYTHQDLVEASRCLLQMRTWFLT